MSFDNHAPIRRPTAAEIQRGWSVIDAGAPERRRWALARWALLPALAVAFVAAWWLVRAPPDEPQAVAGKELPFVPTSSPVENQKPATVQVTATKTRQVVALTVAGRRVDVDAGAAVIEARTESSVAIQRVSASSVRIEVLRGEITISSAEEAQRVMHQGEVAALNDDVVERIAPSARADLKPALPPKNVNRSARSLVETPVAESPPSESTTIEVMVNRGKNAFTLGTEARQRGDFVTALSLYEQFISQESSDARSPLAMMEAARILADHQNEPRRALRYVEALLTRKVTAALREDAMARRVQLLAVTESPKLCHDARDEFLDAYPQSVHVEEVRRACDTQ